MLDELGELQMKRYVLDLPETSTPEELESDFFRGTFLKFGNLFLMAGYYYDAAIEDENPYYGAVYEFTTEKHDCNDEIRLTKISDEFFEDNGHAMAWCMGS